MQDNALFAYAETTPEPNGGMPDPNKYSADRGECIHPQLLPSTAYSYGCRCTGCYKYHAAERHRRATGPMPCAYPGCTNPRRRVQRARYCEEHATSVGYQLKQQHPVHEMTCALCNSTEMVRKPHPLGLCGTCLDKGRAIVRRARMHGVDADRILAWLRQPQCDLCERRLYLGSSTSTAGGFCIDHNHNHCSGFTGCNECVRGLLCVSCNSRLGSYETLMSTIGASRLASYLVRGT